MSIIYSYPEQTTLNDNDTLLGTSATLVGGKKKNITKNFSLSELSNYFGVGSIINPIASDFKLAVFNQGGTKITDSIISQDALAGTSVTIAGNLTANTTTLNGFLTVNGGANLGTGAAGELIAFGSTTRLNAPIQDQLGVVGALDQILISDTAGRVSWQNYTSGLTYTGTWDATNNTTAPQGTSLVSSVGTNGEFYIVTVAGNAQLNGQPATPTTPPYWNVGDWVVFVENGGAGVWQKIDNTSVLTGTGTDNKIAMWTGGATPSVTLTDSLISQDAGAATVTVAGAFTSTGNINGVNITGTGDLSGVNLLLTGTVSLNAQLGNSGQVLTSQGTADAIWANPTPVNNITGSGTANTLSMFTGQYTVGDSVVTQSADALTVDVLTKTVSDSNAYTINTNIGKLTRTGIFPGAGALTSNITIGAPATDGNVDVYGSNIELHTYNPSGSSGSPITLWSSSTAGLGIQLRTDGGSILNVAGNYTIQATGAGAGANPEAIQILSNTGIKFQGQGNAANINFRSYNTNLNDSGDINFISETQEGQAGNVSFSSIATDANGTAGEIRLAGAGISTSATDAVPLGLVIASNGHVKTGSVGDTYTLSAGVKSGTSVPLNLDAASGTDSTVNLTEGTGITLTQTSATEITIAGSAQGVTSVSGTANRISVTAGNTPVVDAITSAVTSISTNLATGAQIQTAINTAVANVGAFQGAYDAATNTPDLDTAPSAAIQNGWFWAVTVAGTFFTENVQIGDFIFANQDNPGATFANWTVIQSGQDIAGSGTTDGATVKGVAGFNSNDFDVSVNGWVEAKDFTGTTPGYVPDASSATAGTFLKEDGTWSAIAPTTGVGSYTTGNGTILSPQTTSTQLAISAISASGSVYTFLSGLSLGDLVQITDGTVNGFFTYSAAGGGPNGWRFTYVSGEIPTNFSTASNAINLRNAAAGAIGTVTSVGLAMPAAFSVTNSPVTSTGNLNVAVNGGTAGQFLDYTGNWSSPGGGVTSVNGGTSYTSTGLPLTVNPTAGAVNVSLGIYAGGSSVGIVPDGGTSSTFLKGNGTWGSPTSASATITTQNAIGNGTNLTFALGATPNGGSSNFVDVFIDGVYQEISKYSISGTNLIFNAGNAPSAGTNVETKTTADYNVGAVVTTASLGQTNTTGNVNLRIIPNYIISNITAEANNLYIFDSTTQAYTLTLPNSPQPGDSIKISIRGGLATNTLAVPATENIMGGVLGTSLVINNATAAFEIIYSGDSSKQGWVIIGNV